MPRTGQLAKGISPFCQLPTLTEDPPRNSRRRSAIVKIHPLSWHDLPRIWLWKHVTPDFGSWQRHVTCASNGPQQDHICPCIAIEHIEPVQDKFQDIVTSCDIMWCQRERRCWQHRRPAGPTYAGGFGFSLILIYWYILYFEISRYISISGWSEAVRSGRRQGGDALPVSSPNIVSRCRSLKIDQTYQTIPSVRARLAQKGSKNIKDKSSTLLNSIGPDAGCSECPAQSDSGRFVYIY